MPILLNFELTRVRVTVKKRRYLAFEEKLSELDDQIEKLKSLKIQEDVDFSSDIRQLDEKRQQILKSITTDLEPYQKVQISRHPDRPGFLQYADFVFDDFIEMKGDRLFSEDASIVGGIGSLDGTSVVVVAHQKGKSTEENMHRNFGMPRPEGYRKALRLMELAERWRLPVISFIDTPGAYPGIEAEERGQAEAIARNILKMTGLKVPILTIVIGEGGSGGALAMAVADRVLMLEYSVYSVISPEGCAAITWKDPAFMKEAASALKLTSSHLKELGIADEIIPESLGGAHRDPLSTAMSIRGALSDSLEQLQKMPIQKVLESRFGRYRGYSVGLNQPQQGRSHAG